MLQVKQQAQRAAEQARGEKLSGAKCGGGGGGRVGGRARTHVGWILWG